MISFFGHIRPLTTELVALTKYCLNVFSVANDRIIFKLTENQDMQKRFEEFKFRPDSTTG